MLPSCPVVVLSNFKNEDTENIIKDTFNYEYDVIEDLIRKGAPYDRKSFYLNEHIEELEEEINSCYADVIISRNYSLYFWKKEARPNFVELKKLCDRHHKHLVFIREYAYKISGAENIRKIGNSYLYDDLNAMSEKHYIMTFTDKILYDEDWKTPIGNKYNYYISGKLYSSGWYSRKHRKVFKSKELEFAPGE